MSTGWATPDARRVPAGRHAAPSPTVLPADRSQLRRDLVAGLLTALGCVLLAAPAGLLWSALAPKVRVRLADGGAQLAVPDDPSFIAGDGTYLFVVLAAGVLTGLLAWRVGRAHGPTVVLGLAAGGLLAAYVARATGELVDAGAVEAAVAAGATGLELPVRLRLDEALFAWPVGALVSYVLVSLLREREG